MDTAVLIPAGGRYDLVFTAPATPVALFADGRLVYSTGPVSTATGGWPVLDPLIYGAGSPVPWSRFDRRFTIVLDRGLDLRGLLPRYAHTVNGAAYPHIPPQVVRPGDIVEFTIVNRSLVDNPGMWANHCHNLAHADAGMMPHLVYG